MRDDSIGVNDFNIYALGGEAVSYALKNIHTIAVQVTEEKIGIFCLELQTELLYISDGSPFFEISVKRGTEEEPEYPRRLTVRPGDWLIVLWDEIHLLKDKEMRHTFSFDESVQFHTDSGVEAPPVEKEPTSYIDDEGTRRPMPGMKGELDVEGTQIIQPVERIPGELQKPENGE